MAQPEGMHYRALRDIYTPGGGHAYTPGMLVHESAVDGPDAWLILGEDVEPVEGVRLDVPARNASQALWAAYMTSAGMDAAEAQGMSRAQLVAAWDAADEAGREIGVPLTLAGTAAGTDTLAAAPD